MVAIAYVDEDGNGFSNDEPWIYEVCDGDVKKRVSELVQIGLKKVTPFIIQDELESYS